jgi:ATP-dependent Lon protease
MSNDLKKKDYKPEKENLKKKPAVKKYEKEVEVHDDDDDSDDDDDLDDEYETCDSDEEDDEEEDDEYDSEEYDSEESFDSDEEEEDSESDSDYEPPKKKGKKRYNLRGKQKASKKKNEKIYIFLSDKKKKKKPTKQVERVEEEENEDDSVSSVESVKKKETKEKSVEENVSSSEALLTKFMTLYEKSKDEKIIKGCIKGFQDIIKKEELRQEKKIEKQSAKNGRIFRKLLKQRKSNNDYDYFMKLPIEKQIQIIKEMRNINESIFIKTPYRIRLLELEIPTTFKISAMKKVTMLKSMEQDPGCGEYYKCKLWVDGFMKIPFNTFHQLPVKIQDGVEKCDEFIGSAKRILDEAVFGLENAKMQIIQWLGQIVTNPDSIGTSIAIQGPPGTGKTSLIKEGISKILNRPFAFIALGGATDSSFLDGHCYTYEGSTYGKIVQILIESKCMNPIIFFDELDKISETPKGEEITGILTHLTDTTQNSQFHDKFYSELDFDLSKCLFIFSYNDDSKLNPILKDRMYRITTKGFDAKQKSIIASQYLIPRLQRQIQFKVSEITFPEDTIQYIVNTFCAKEDGVRNLKRCIEIILTKLNLFRLLKPENDILQKDFKSIGNIQFPLQIQKELLEKLLSRDELMLQNANHLSMYI